MKNKSFDFSLYVFTLLIFISPVRESKSSAVIVSSGMYLKGKYNLASIMSKKKNAPLPASSAGLLRFFEDETRGVKVKPELVLAVTGALIGVSLLIRVIFPV